MSNAARTRLEVVSSLDGSRQPNDLIRPPGVGTTPRPLLVSLHTWSFDLNQGDEPLERLALERGWLVLYPNFRGRNDSPAACGSALARQDILDAVAQVQADEAVDARRLYLTGCSGGGHLTMLMAGRHPEPWAAASAWVGISDLAAWHERHRDGEYGANLRACCGGAPGDSAAVDAEYRDRSPLTWLAGAAALPLDLSAGIHDGHQGSVPVRHTLDAYNAVARAVGGEPVSANEMAQLSLPHGRLAHPRPSDQVSDETFGRDLWLRREAGRCRVTIFEGGHEGLATATIAWLERHCKP